MRFWRLRSMACKKAKARDRTICDPGLFSYFHPAETLDRLSRRGLKYFAANAADDCQQLPFLAWPGGPVSYTHLTLPTNREV